jgi:uncharacterized protein (DUF362 family)
MEGRARTRRQFLADAARAAVLLPAAAAGCFPDAGGKWAEERIDCAPPAGAPPGATSRVVEAYSATAVVTDPDTLRNTIDAAAARAMVDAVVSALAAGAPEPWRALLPDCTPSTRVGIKVNTLNPECPTSPAVARALVDGLKAGLGLPADRIVVWDRRDDELQRAGFTEASMGATVMATLSSTGQSPGYEGAYCVVNGKTTRLSRILTELTDVTINCPVLKTHGVSGVTAALKNVYGVIDNPADFHADLVTALPAIYAIAPLRERIRLTVVDALVAITVGGTSSPVDTVPKRLLASQDPLAADSRAVALVNELRAAKGLGLADVDARLTAWLGRGEALGLGALRYDLVSLQT